MEPKNTSYYLSQGRRLGLRKLEGENETVGLFLATCGLAYSAEKKLAYPSCFLDTCEFLRPVKG